MDVQSRIARASSTLTPAERRVAEVVLARPQLVAFGTVVAIGFVAGRLATVGDGEARPSTTAPFGFAVAGMTVAMGSGQLDLAWMGPWGYIIANNATGMSSDLTRGAVRDGELLLPGLLRCGHCGRASPDRRGVPHRVESHRRQGVAR